MEAKANDEALEKAKKAIQTAKLGLLGLGPNMKDSPSAVFFGHLVFRLKMVPCTSFVRKVPGGTLIQLNHTLATDGARIFYNPNFVNSISVEELIGVICHEVMHCVLNHHTRLRYANRDRAQIACDLAVNPHVLQAGFKLPMMDRLAIPGQGQFSKMPKGLSAEEYYNLYKPKAQEQEEGGGGKGKRGASKQPSLSDIGSVFIPDEIEGGDDPDLLERASENEWKMAMGEAAVLAKQKGTVPGDLGVLLDELFQTPKLDWRTILAQFLTVHCRDDYSWLRPSRRSHLGAVLPQLFSDRPGHVVVAIDTSGSVSDQQLREFCEELSGIMSCLPARVTVIWCDARVQRVDEWEPSDGPFKPKPAGRGGTSHRPVFNWVDKNCDEPPICLVCLTDLYTDFPSETPGYPVLWVTVGSEDAPFGEVVKL